MKLVEPKVFLIGTPQINREEVQAWLEEMGVGEFELPRTATNGELLVQLAGKRCYKSFVAGVNPNVTKVRKEVAEFIENILKVGHGSVLEHATYNFALENVSRVFTAEMNRHRAGMAISEGSLRFIRFDDIPFWIPDSIQVRDTDGPDLTQKKLVTQGIFLKALKQDEDNYKELVKVWDMNAGKNFSVKKKLTSMFRRIIPLGVASGGVWSGNLRALRHIFTMRCDTAAEEEITIVATKMLQKMLKVEPNFFKDFEYVDGAWRPKYKKV